MTYLNIFTITSSIAGCAMAICQVPQAYRVWKTQDTSGISIWMQMLLTTGVFFWFTSGVVLSLENFTSGMPMWLSNGFSLIFCTYILIKKVRQSHFS